MSKKTFSTAPKPKQPTDDQILAFERKGSGHDTSPETAQGRSDGPTKRLSLDLPADLHMRFKTACTASGNKMIGEIQAFIERRTAELETESGIVKK